MLNSGDAPVRETQQASALRSVIYAKGLKQSPVRSSSDLNERYLSSPTYERVHRRSRTAAVALLDRRDAVKSFTQTARRTQTPGHRRLSAVSPSIIWVDLTISGRQKKAFMWFTVLIIRSVGGPKKNNKTNVPKFIFLKI